MPIYRKKPVTVEAHRFDGSMESAHDIIKWLDMFGASAWIVRPTGLGTAVCFLKIETLEGDMLAHPQHMIIKGAMGEFYPCRDDIFDATYESVYEGPG